MNIALIDGDEIAYKGAFCSSVSYFIAKDGDRVITKGKNKSEVIENIGNNDSDEIILEQKSDITNLNAGYKAIDSILSTILYQTNSKEYIIYLTGENNFRKELATILPYKAHRSTKPASLSKMEEYLKYKKAITIDYLEADDCISAASFENKNSVICSQDKDLDTVPSLRYNPSSNQIYEVSEQDALYNFYLQLIIGDKTDNIPSAYGCGKVYAAKVLKECYEKNLSEYEYYKVAKEAILNKLNQGKTSWYNPLMDIDEVLYEIGNLLYMHRTFDKEERWSVEKKE